MKSKFSKVVTITMSLLSLGFLGCNNGSNDPARELIGKKKISINWDNASSSEEISGFAAKVSVYNMNNREDTSLKLSSTYNIATKLINGENYVRLDMLDESSDQQYRSVISNEKEMVIINTGTGEVEYRMPVNLDTKDIAFLQDGVGMGKVNLDKIKAEAKRLAFDVTEDSNETKLLVNLPNDLFTNQFSRRISTKVTYDTVSETLENMETIDIKDDGSTVTTSIDYIYQECDDNLVKVGMITTIDTKYDNLIEGVDENLPYFDSIDDIPEISDEEFERLSANGNIFKNDSIKFGNPADLSSVVTIVEVYENIEINNIDDSVFKLLF